MPSQAVANAPLSPQWPRILQPAGRRAWATKHCHGRLTLSVVGATRLPTRPVHCQAASSSCFQAENRDPHSDHTAGPSLLGFRTCARKWRGGHKSREEA